METVPRPLPDRPPQADYRRSVELIARAASHQPPLVTKSGIMVGLGETREEVLEVMADLRKAGCHLLPWASILAPSADHHPVVRYVTPEEFEQYKRMLWPWALRRGQCTLCAKSYEAETLYQAARAKLQS